MAGVPPKRATSPAQPPALAGVKPTYHTEADSTLKTGGNDGVSEQNSVHGRPVSQGLPDSTPAAVPCVPLDNPSLSRLQQLPPTHGQPAQGEDSIMPPPPQVCTMSDTTLTNV